MGLRPHRSLRAGSAGPVRQGDSGGQIGVGGHQIPQRVAGGEVGTEVAEGSHQSIERAVARADDAVVADHVDIDPVGGAEGEVGGVPDGVERYVV